MPDDPAYGGLIRPEFQKDFEIDVARIFHGLFRNHFLRVEQELGSLLHEKDLKIEELTAQVHTLENHLAKLRSK